MSCKLSGQVGEEEGKKAGDCGESLMIRGDDEPRVCDRIRLSLGEGDNLSGDTSPVFVLGAIVTARFRRDGTVGELSPGFFCRGRGIGRLAGVSEVDVPLLDGVDEATIRRGDFGGRGGGGGDSLCGE